MLYLTQFIFYGIPIALILFFVISLWRYCYARSENKREPGRFSAEEMIKRKSMLIVSAVIAGAAAVVVIALMLLLYTAVAFM